MGKKEFLKGMAAGAGFVILIICIFFGGSSLINLIQYGAGHGIININNIAVDQKISTIESLINSKSYFDADSGKVEAGIYKGLVSGLGDKYAAYYTAEEYSRFKESNDGRFTGIGVVFKSDSSQCIISKVYEGSPAEACGMKVGDVIVRLEGNDVSKKTYTEISAMIKEKEGQEVTITVRRGEAKELIDFNIKVQTVTITTVKGYMLDPSIGYINLIEFDTITSEQFKEIFSDLQSKGMERLIIDLRDNPGGLISSVTSILDYLLPEGALLEVKSRDGKSEFYYSNADAALTIPCLLITNGNSASAAEIFAGAMRDNYNAIIVGTTTYGKGIIQSTYPLADGSAVKLTTAQYYTPSGYDIQGRGIIPDYKQEASDNGDAQLNRAIEEVKKIQK